MPVDAGHDGALDDLDEPEAGEAEEEAEVPPDVGQEVAPHVQHVVHVALCGDKCFRINQSIEKDTDSPP